MKKRITGKAKDLGIIDEIMNNAPKGSIHFINRCTEITEQIFRMLDERGWKQKDLAEAMNKSEAEISKMLSGSHNLTLRTIALIETILEENIILTKAGLNLKAERNEGGMYWFSKPISAIQRDDTSYNQDVITDSVGNYLELEKSAA